MREQCKVKGGEKQGGDSRFTERKGEERAVSKASDKAASPLGGLCDEQSYA